MLHVSRPELAGIHPIPPTIHTTCRVREDEQSVEYTVRYQYNTPPYQITYSTQSVAPVVCTYMPCYAHRNSSLV
jgi:hypothetical protein